MAHNGSSLAGAIILEVGRPNLRPFARASLVKSSDHLWLAAIGGWRQSYPRDLLWGSSALASAQPQPFFAVDAFDDDVHLEAHYLLAETRDILDRMNSVAGTMKSLQSGQRGNLNVACMPGPFTFLFPRFVSRYVGDNPDIRVSLSSRTSPQIRELAATQGIDFGFSDMIGRAPSEGTFGQETIAADCFWCHANRAPLRKGTD